MTGELCDCGDVRYAVVAMYVGPAFRGLIRDNENEIDVWDDDQKIWREVSSDEYLNVVDERFFTRAALDAYADGCDALAAGLKE